MLHLFLQPIATNRNKSQPITPNLVYCEHTINSAYNINMYYYIII